ncbi:MAG: ABC transporter ATP-binding protein [Pseudomonadota bacterium]
MTEGSEAQHALDIKDISFAWPGTSAFRIEVPNLKLAAGERTALFGESGSGKTTLLSLICGIVSPTRGTVHLDGTDLGQLGGSARDRLRANRIGVIFQQFNLLPFATPLDNILLPLQFASERRARVSDPKSEALRLTEALGLSDDLVVGGTAAQLSVGQQQRIAVARALIGKPSLIIADEPTSALDASSQRDFLDLLLTQCDEASASLLMVTHDDRLASAFGRIVEMNELCRISRGAAA